VRVCRCTASFNFPRWHTEIRAFLSNGGEKVCNSIRTTENFLPASAGTFHQIICRGSTIEYHMLHTTIMDDVAMDLHMNKMKNTRLIQRERRPLVSAICPTREEWRDGDEPCTRATVRRRERSHHSMMSHSRFRNDGNSWIATRAVYGGHNDQEMGLK
jgi:hypothetical protein